MIMDVSLCISKFKTSSSVPIDNKRRSNEFTLVYVQYRHRLLVRKRF